MPNEQPIWEADKVAVFSPHHTCNFKCPYCISATQTEAKPDSRVYDSSIWIDLVQNNWMIEISGGEPLLSPQTIMFANKLVAMGGRVLILTNGTNLQEYERLLSDGVGVLACWHPSQIPLREFYCVSERKNTKYKYMLHPQYLEQCGRFWRDMEQWKSAAKKNVLNIGVFEGEIQGEFLCADHPRYRFLTEDGRDSYIRHLFMPRKNLIIESNGSVYGNYYMDQPMGSVFDYDMRNLETLPPKPYIAIRKDLRDLEKAQIAYAKAIDKVFQP